MANAIAFLILCSFLVFVALYSGIVIGRNRERERRRAIDADNHARSFREASALAAATTDKSVLLDMLRRTPGFSIEEAEAYNSDIVRVRRKNQRAYVIFEFTQATGHLLAVEPCT